MSGGCPTCPMIGGRKRGRGLRTKNRRSRKMRNYRGGMWPFTSSNNNDEYTPVFVNEDDSFVDATGKRVGNFGKSVKKEVNETARSWRDWWYHTPSNGTQYSTQTTMGGKGSRRRRRTKRNKNTRKM